MKVKTKQITKDMHFFQLLWSFQPPFQIPTDSPWALYSESPRGNWLNTCWELLLERVSETPTVVGTGNLQVSPLGHIVGHFWKAQQFGVGFTSRLPMEAQALTLRSLVGGKKIHDLIGLFIYSSIH